jgi:predicted permease
MLIRRILYLLNRPRLERELEDEMAAHREAMDPGDRIRFGSSLRLREEARDAWGWAWLDALAQDLRFGCRILLRSPAFTAAIVAVAALGIGVALTAFQVFNVLVLRPLPIRAPENVFALTLRGPDSYSDVASYPLFEFIRDHNRPLSAAFAEMPAEVQVGRDAELRAAARFVTSNYLSELAAGPAWGRLLDPAWDARPGAPPVVVLSYRFWQQRFESDPAAVGRTIYVDGRPATVAGVVAADFNGIGWTAVDLWIPLEQHAWFFPNSDLLQKASRRALHAYARLRPPISAASAEAGLLPLAEEFRGAYPGAIGSSQRVICTPAGRAIRLRPRDADAVTFFGALVVLVLAVSLSNAGTLLLSRSLARAREIWIRSSVGAGRFRLVRQLATESALIAILASALGLALSYWGATAALGSLETPLKATDALDWRTVAAAFALMLCSAALFGVTPALHILRPGHRAGRLRSILIATQVASSCVLLIVAGLYTRGLQRVFSTPLGFEYRDVVGIDPAFRFRGYSADRARESMAEMKRRVEGAPGVVSVSTCSSLPFSGEFWMESVRTPSDHGWVNPNVYAVDPEYFQTMRIAILAGRTFRPGERNAVIVSESLARKAWPGEHPLGKPLPTMGPAAGPGRLVVGIAASARTGALSDGAATEMYFPAGDADPAVGLALLARTAGDPRVHLPAIRIAAMLPNEPPPHLELLTDGFDRATSGTRKGAAAIGVTGLLTLLIAAMGIAGLLFYAVSQRTREIGIRVALGAGTRDVVRAVLTQAVRPVGVGLILGAAAGCLISSLMQHQIYGISRLDPPAYLGALGLLAAAALAAASAPIRRALRVNAVDALRHE